MTAVLKHELKSYFRSMTAYVFGAGLLLAVGLGAMLYNIEAAVSNFEFALSYFSIIFAVIVPILTMRVIAEERKQKTDQLLYSLPITTTQVIVGKYLALLTVYMIPLCIVAVYPLIFSQFGDVYLLTSYGSMLAFFIMGAALIALGVFISSLTENQVVAAVGALVCCMVLMMLNVVSSAVPAGFLRDCLNSLAFYNRYYPLTAGVFNAADLLYFISFIVVFNFLTMRVLEKRRWA